MHFCGIKYSLMYKLSFLLLLFSLSAAAQPENWDAYMMEYEKGPGSVLINMGAKQSAPYKTLPFLITTGVTFSNCTTEGLPPADEFSELYSISDSARYIVEKNTTSLLVGTFTYQCQRLDYYYTRDTANLRRELARMYIDRFPGYTPVVIIRPDSSWRTYLDFLYPKEEVIEFMNDQKVVMRLRDAGDDPSKERQIGHWLYFPTETDRRCIFNYLAENKFIIEGMDKTDNPAYPFSLHISRNDKTDINIISKITKALSIQARLCKGVYDGWESPVVK